MSAFEFVFSLFGLLLGLSLAEVLHGFVKVVRARERVTIGWQAPLLGLFLMLQLASFWIVAWSAQDVIPPSYASLVFGLVVTGAYYLAAALVFPDRPEEWPEGLDDYYAKHKRPVIAGMVLCSLLARGAQFALGAEDYSVWVPFVLTLSFLALMTALFFVRGRRANIAILSVLIAHQLSQVAQGSIEV